MASTGPRSSWLWAPSRRPRRIRPPTSTTVVPHSTKLLLDITIPANPSGPAYLVGFGAWNYAFNSTNYPTGL